MRLQLAWGKTIGLRHEGLLSRVVALTIAVGGTVLAADKESEGGKQPAGGLKTTASLEASGYTDSDHVHVATPSIAGSISDDVAGWSVAGRYLVDVVSAASVDIVSNASGKWTENRHVGSASAKMKWSDLSLAASGNVSSEPDYLSLAAGLTLSVDLADKNVTPFVGFSHGQDNVGRTGLPREFWQTLQTTGFQLGTTFVVDRSTIASVQGDAILDRGYLAKPYRYLPLFAPGQGDSIQPGASVAEVNRQRLPERPAEQVPSARNRFAITGRVAHRMDASTIRVDERVYGDSWNLTASTTDARYMFDLSRSLILWPHLRFHIQNEVAFWKRAYEATRAADGSLGVPLYRTGDRELGSLHTVTFGAGARFTLSKDIRKSWALVFEIDGAYTRYLDTLYLTERRSLFSTLALEAELD
jgi:hypothetical protein